LDFFIFLFEKRCLKPQEKGWKGVNMESPALTEKDLEKVVLDTSALIHLPDFTAFGQVFTVQGVIDESKDRLTKMKLESLASEIKIISPEPSSIEDIKELASSSGDLENLSDTDIALLALASQLRCPILTDDYRIQNVAGHLGIKFSSVFTPGIRRLKGENSG
jgi:rRNA maturation endonuclease Nob1